MKKFEIVNDKWIKQTVFKDDKYFKSRFSAVRIDKINYWDSQVFDIGTGINHLIHFYSDFGLAISLDYDKEEARQYAEDLVFFKKLLFEQ